MKRIGLTIIAAVACFVSTPLYATPITLDFENIAPFPNGSDVLIEGYYNGGTSSIGTSGPNDGVSFSAGATLLCLNTLTVDCSNTSRGGLGIPTSQLGAMFFPSVNPIMDVAAGFTTGFSMEYGNPFDAAVNVQVWSGLDGTGSLLAQSSLAATTNGALGACSAYGSPNYCPFAPFSLGFAGTAESIVFGGSANISVYDDITFGSTTVGGGGDNTPVPEPGTILLVCSGLVGLARRRRQQRA